VNPRYFAITPIVPVLEGKSVGELFELETYAPPLPLTVLTTHSTALDTFFVVLSVKVATALSVVVAPFASALSTEDIVMDSSTASVTVTVMVSVSPKYLAIKLNTPGPVDVNFVPSADVATDAVPDPLMVETTHSTAVDIFFVVLSEKVTNEVNKVDLPLAKELCIGVALIDSSTESVTVTVIVSVSPKYLPIKLNTPGPVDVNLVPSADVATDAVPEPLTVDTAHSTADVTALVVLSERVAAAETSVNRPLAKLVESALILID